MDKEPPQPSGDHEEDTVVPFPEDERTQARRRHPAGKLGRKSIQETLRDLGMLRAVDDDET